MFGFVIATLVAVPLGIVSGLSPVVNAGLNPIVQIFKPVSQLAWLPIVTMVVSAVYVSQDPTFSKSFLVSAITVTLCSLWCKPCRENANEHQGTHDEVHRIPGNTVLIGKE
jgi:nitrate/nitrite transport system permease protein